MLLEEMEEFECEVGESSQLSPSDTAKKMGKEQQNNSMNKSTAAAATSRTTTTTAPAAECMRFLVRCALLAAALLTLFLLALLAIQQHNLERHKVHRTQQQSPAERRAAALAGQEPTEEEREARRLLLLAGNQPDEGVAVPASGQQLPQLETAVGAGLLFPIGRYPQGNRAAGAHGAGQLTLNVVVVLVVSLLSVAVLITAICCVIIIALAMDSATALEANRRGGSSASTDFLLASWPHLQMGAEASATGQLAKLFQRQPPDPFFEDNTPPLTDDELDQLDAADLELGLLGGASEREQQSYYDDRIPLVLEEEPESGRSWPAMAWGQLRRQRERREQAVATITTTSATAAGRAVISSRLPLEREQGNGRGQAPLGSTSIC